MRANIIALAIILVGVVFMVGCQSEKDMVPDVPPTAEDRPGYVMCD